MLYQGAAISCFSCSLRTNRQTSKQAKEKKIFAWEIHEISSMIICVFFSQFSKLSNKAVPYTFSWQFVKLKSFVEKLKLVVRYSFGKITFSKSLVWELNLAINPCSCSLGMIASPYTVHFTAEMITTHVNTKYSLLRDTVWRTNIESMRSYLICVKEKANVPWQPLVLFWERKILSCALRFISMPELSTDVYSTRRLCR